MKSKVLNNPKESKRGGTHTTKKIIQVPLSISAEEIVSLCDELETIISIVGRSTNDKYLFLGDIMCKSKAETLRCEYAKSEYFRLLKKLGLPEKTDLDILEYMYRSDYETQFAVAYILNKFYCHVRDKIELIHSNSTQMYIATACPEVLMTEFEDGRLTNSKEEIQELVERLSKDVAGEFMFVCEGIFQVVKFLPNRDGTSTAHWGTINLSVTTELNMPF